LVLVADNASAQWVNRYAELSGFGQHAYLEQHQLPFLAHGLADAPPAQSPLRSGCGYWNWKRTSRGG